ncbi:MAG TPA: FAD-dependent thymidylate synthase [Candidatus Babeliales bacterium]|nr:FAD-dependent thymidylate synthase [Candidatus Babeliales bacterium]
MENVQNSLQTQDILEYSLAENGIDPLGDGISSVELVRVSGSDLDVVNAARVSYGKVSSHVSDRDKKLIAFLMEHNHTSPFEHNQLSFRIKAPIFVARQWMRHRMNSYNEISYRYVKASLEFYIPPKWRSQDTKNKQASIGSFDNPEFTQKLKDAIAYSVQTYEYLLENGIGREIARSVLPLCTYTEFIFTCNLHSLMHFLKLRLHAGAQYEIRMYAQTLLKLALPHFPISLEEWKRIHAHELEIETDLFTQNFTATAE